MADNLFINTFLVVSTLVLIWLMVNIVRTFIMSGLVFMAVAGANMPGTVRSRSWKEVERVYRLVDNQGKPIDRRCYNAFIVSGKSMLLSGVENGDLLLTKPVTNLHCKQLFPCLMVLRREKNMIKEAESVDDHALYKIRRTWLLYQITDNFEDLKSAVEEIMKQEDFHELMIKAGTAYKGDEWMMQELSKSFERYKREHKACTHIRDKNHQVLISTTLYTDKDEVRFSIHPSRIIVGKVAFAYSLRVA